MKFWHLIVICVVFLFFGFYCWSKKKHAVLPDHSVDNHFVDSVTKNANSRYDELVKFTEANNKYVSSLEDSIAVLSSKRSDIRKDQEILKLQAQVYFLNHSNSNISVDTTSILLKRCITLSSQANDSCNKEISLHIKKEYALQTDNEKMDTLLSVFKSDINAYDLKYKSLYSDYKKATTQHIKVYTGPDFMYSKGQPIYLGGDVQLLNKKQNKLYDLRLLYNKQSYFSGGVRFLITFKK